MLGFVRIIPVTIIAALILLGVKVGEVWSGVREAVERPATGVEAMAAPVPVPEAPQAAAGAGGGTQADAGTGPGAGSDDDARRFVLPAQARSGNPATGPEARPLVVASAAQAQEAGGAGNANGDATGGEATGADAGVPAAPATAPAATREGAVAPTEFSQAEIELLQNLSRRRDELDGREQQLEMRENLLAATEKRIEERIEELRRIEAQIDSLLVKYDEQRERQVESLVRIYQNMKAKDAARIFERLDMNVLLEVAENMNSRALAPILAEMDANRAQKITVELATRRQLPGTN